MDTAAPPAPSEAPEPVWLTVAEAAEILRLPRSTAYDLVAKGQIPSKRYGRRIRIPRHAITP